MKSVEWPYMQLLFMIPVIASIQIQKRHQKILVFFYVPRCGQLIRYLVW